jgi:DNA-binding transcriptional regulator YiaG
MKGKELRAIRARLRLTQVRMSERLGVTANTVARWERGEVGISEAMSRLVKLVAHSGRSTKKGRP